MPASSRYLISLLSNGRLETHESFTGTLEQLMERVHRQWPCTDIKVYRWLTPEDWRSDLEPDYWIKLNHDGHSDQFRLRRNVLISMAADYFGSTAEIEEARSRAILAKLREAAADSRKQVLTHTLMGAVSMLIILYVASYPMGFSQYMAVLGVAAGLGAIEAYYRLLSHKNLEALAKRCGRLNDHVANLREALRDLGAEHARSYGGSQIWLLDTLPTMLEMEEGSARQKTMLLVIPPFWGADAVKIAMPVGSAARMEDTGHNEVILYRGKFWL